MNMPAVNTPSGTTRMDLRLTRAPADSRRARLHRAAALGSRVWRNTHRVLGTLDVGAMERLRALSQRGLGVLRGHPRLGESEPARLLQHVCWGLDRVLSALIPLMDPGFATLCEELTRALVELEVAEERIQELQRDLKLARQDVAFERSHNEQLRASLAAEQVRSTAALREVPAERWEEATRSRDLTDEEKRVIDDPEAYR